jgi:hypothetical protein
MADSGTDGASLDPEGYLAHEPGMDINGTTADRRDFINASP